MLILGLFLLIFAAVIGGSALILGRVKRIEASITNIIDFIIPATVTELAKRQAAQIIAYQRNLDIKLNIIGCDLEEVNKTVQELLTFVDALPEEQEKLNSLFVVPQPEQPTGRDYYQILQKSGSEWQHHSNRPLNHPDLKIFEETAGYAIKSPDGTINYGRQA